jgi:hypothetical protein
MRSAVVALAVLIVGLAVVLVRGDNGGQTRAASGCTYTSVYYPRSGGPRFWLIGVRDTSERGHVERVPVGRTRDGRRRWLCLVRAARPRLAPGGDVALRQG